MSNEFAKWCKDRGITRQHTTKATPSQNGVAERLNRTLAEGVIAMLNQAKLPESYWGQAVLYLTHILNSTPTSSLSDTTSFEVWKGRKPDFTRYRIFGCRAYAHVQKKEQTAFSSHTQKCIFIGFEDGVKGWKLYDPTAQKVIISRDVIFNESFFPGLSKMSLDNHKPLSLNTLWTDEEEDPKDNEPSANQGPPPGAPPPPQAPGPAPGPPPRRHTPPPPPDSDGFSSDWEEDKNLTGRPRTQLTPPRYLADAPETHRSAQRHGICPDSPESPSR